MKIDKNKYPFLERYEKGKIGQLQFHESLLKQLEIYRDEIYAIFKKKPKIEYLSDTVFDVLFRKDILEKMTPLRKDIEDCWGFVLNGNKTYLYEFKRNDTGVNFNLFLFQGITFYAYETGYVTYENEVRIIQGLSFDMENHEGQMYLGPNTGLLFQEMSTFVLFKKYAQIETKLAAPKKTTTTLNCAYENQTKFWVNIIDSTWFTTLVKSDAFKVSGHFRLQPIGEGRKERKLIWIKDFEKQGYTREAKMLSSNET